MSEAVIQSNSGYVKEKGSYGEHLDASRVEYKPVMSRSFPSGNARDAYAREHIEREHIEREHIEREHNRDAVRRKYLGHQ